MRFAFTGQCANKRLSWRQCGSSPEGSIIPLERPTPGVALDQISSEELGVAENTLVS